MQVCRCTVLFVYCCYCYCDIEHSNCTAETDSLRIAVDVQCCMSIADIDVVTNGLSALLLALLY